MKKISLFILRHGENYWKKENNKNANTYWLSIVKYETMAHINVESKGRIHPTNK